MSHNTIRARLDFSFKGEGHELDTVIDLEACADAAGEETPDFHRLLAQAHGIDTYSYLYEALESYDIEFSEPTGIAAGCCHDGILDWPCFAAAWREERELRALRPIAARVMGIDDLDGHAALKAALLAAYRAGRSGAEG